MIREKSDAKDRLNCIKDEINNRINLNDNDCCAISTERNYELKVLIVIWFQKRKQDLTELEKCLYRLFMQKKLMLKTLNTSLLRRLAFTHFS